MNIVMLHGKKTNSFKKLAGPCSGLDCIGSFLENPAQGTLEAFENVLSTGGDMIFESTEFVTDYLKPSTYQKMARDPINFFKNEVGEIIEISRVTNLLEVLPDWLKKKIREFVFSSYGRELASSGTAISAGLLTTIVAKVGALVATLTAPAGPIVQGSAVLLAEAYVLKKIREWTLEAIETAKNEYENFVNQGLTKRQIAFRKQGAFYAEKKAREALNKEIQNRLRRESYQIRAKFLQEKKLDEIKQVTSSQKKASESASIQARQSAIFNQRQEKKNKNSLLIGLATTALSML